MDEEIKTWNANLAILLERLKRADTAPEVVIHLFRNCVIKSVEILKPNVMVQRKMPRGFKARLVGILI